MKEEVKEWLERAESDLSDAVFNYENSRRAPAAFFLHQAAEKALKAWQIHEEGEYDYTHDLLKLADEKVKDRFFETLRDLNPVYTGVRYPDMVLEDIENLENLKKGVEQLVTWTRKRLKE